MLRGQALRVSSQSWRRQTRRIDHLRRQQFAAVLHLHQPTLRRVNQARHRRVQGHAAASVFKIALQAQHQGVAVHNAGAG